MGKYILKRIFFEPSKNNLNTLKDPLLKKIYVLRNEFQNKIRVASAKNNNQKIPDEIKMKPLDTFEEFKTDFIKTMSCAGNRLYLYFLGDKLFAMASGKVHQTTIFKHQGDKIKNYSRLEFDMFSTIVSSKVNGAKVYSLFLEDLLPKIKVVEKAERINLIQATNKLEDLVTHFKNATVRHNQKNKDFEMVYDPLFENLEKPHLSKNFKLIYFKNKHAIRMSSHPK